MRDVQLNLMHFTSPLFQAKLAASLAVIERALKRRKRPYIALSMGKDSVVVTALVHAICPDVTIAWTDDELEYPETVQMMTRLQEIAGDQLIVTLGRSQHAGWFTPWTDAPYWRDPLPGSHRKTIPQDDWMAARGYGLTFLGTRAAESHARRDWLQSAGPLYTVARGAGLRCCPIAEWSSDDVWALIAGWMLPHNPVYDRLTEIGVHRDVQRVGPLPLTPRQHLAEGWPDLLAHLEARYGQRWS